jgi:hypothetical protein
LEYLFAEIKMFIVICTGQLHYTSNLVQPFSKSHFKSLPENPKHLCLYHKTLYMQKILFLLFFGMATFHALAQGSSDEIWKTESRTEPTNVFQRADEIANSSRGRTTKLEPKPEDDPNLQTAPIDGGLSVLLVAGALYGGRKLKQNRKKSFNPASTK